MIEYRIGNVPRPPGGPRPPRPPGEKPVVEGAAGIRIAARFLADCAEEVPKTGDDAHLRGRRHDPWEHACCLLSGDFLCPTGDAFTDSLPVLGREASSGALCNFVGKKVNQFQLSLVNCGRKSHLFTTVGVFNVGALICH